MTGGPAPDTARKPAGVPRPPRLALQDVADAFPFGFLVTDEFGLIVEANEEAGTLMHVKRHFLVGKPVVTLASGKYARTMRSALVAIRRDGASVRWEQELSPRRGEPFPVEVTAVPLEGGSHVLWVISDIRDRVAVERRARMLTGDVEAGVLERTQELETERARLAAVMSQIPAGLVMVDAPEGNVVSMNDEALRILRVSTLRDDRSWQGWKLDGTEYGPEEWPVARSRLHGEVVTGERAQVLAGDGTRIVLDISSAPIRDGDGQLIGAVSIFSDLTTRERHDRVEREFVMNAAHELQTPLAALVSAVDVLMGGAKDTPERDLFLSHISREADRLTRLVRALLLLARVELGAEEPMMAVVSIAPLLEAIAGELHPPPAVTVSVSCPDDLAALSDPVLLRHAVESLAGNAVKYTQEGSIVLEGRRSNGIVQISVADTGPGIPPEERPLVFERFHRGEGSETGSGLGLVIVRAIAEALGGELELDSAVGRGTTVRIRLPRATTILDS